MTTEIIILLLVGTTFLVTAGAGLGELVYRAEVRKRKSAHNRWLAEYYKHPLYKPRGRKLKP